MSKFVETTYTNKKSILKFPDHYVNLTVTVSDAGVTANAEGKKIVPAGTIVGGGFLASESVMAVKKNDAAAEGVLFNDVDVTYGPAPGAAMIHGFVALDKLPEVPTAEAIAALKQITFLK
ncbi:hypothetical protein M670_00444 [Schinkia azotoformans MEV2011]|uniref:Bacteriophage lambda head decoration protein D n=1 Tax=Schinkia azotoformans MEV2011 TaxID=1348973 RepID=A0A072NU61_SCHAZ|nr:hypothetical protein [Schinkia azotoformans]KEF40418.1 hypothetical protein M670_00444 [Schinkia azotoformans MEV2011]MEC1696171.1 hypothetical protein [Schinkia azotoformans]MEC1716615.1 hypothetical protein [Schinkia azotoformans]MEC1725326.1 hypothetical protein [Schinkia azotoformans]MEC1739453.1 hypothetical protein [Schinkia azotoformans]